jgi:two-component system aerobic respiration control sensor histidine kinase ArcB
LLPSLLNWKSSEVLFDATAAQELERTFSADELSSVYDEFILSIHNKLSVCESTVLDDPEQVIKTLHRLASTALQLGFNQFGLALKHAERSLLDKQDDIDFELLSSLWRQTFNDYLAFAQKDL